MNFIESSSRNFTVCHVGDIIRRRHPEENRRFPCGLCHRVKVSNGFAWDRVSADSDFETSGGHAKPGFAKAHVAKKQQQRAGKVNKGKNVLPPALTLWHNSSNFSIGGVVWAGWWSQNSN